MLLAEHTIVEMHGAVVDLDVGNREAGRVFRCRRSGGGRTKAAPEWFVELPATVTLVKVRSPRVPTSKSAPPPSSELPPLIVALLLAIVTFSALFWELVPSR